MAEKYKLKGNRTYFLLLDFDGEELGRIESKTSLDFGSKMIDQINQLERDSLSKKAEKAGRG